MSQINTQSSFTPWEALNSQVNGITYPVDGPQFLSCGPMNAMSVVTQMGLMHELTCPLDLGG